MKRIYKILIMASVLCLMVGCGKKTVEQNSEHETESLLTQMVETEITEVENPTTFTEIENIKEENNTEISAEVSKPQVEVESGRPDKQEGSIVKDQFVEKIYNLYSKEKVVFYDAPSLDANVITEVDSYVMIVLEAYNAKTGWYRTSLGVNDEDFIGYCRLDNCYTTEEYRAVLNKGVEEKYWCLSCVAEAENYAKNFITTVTHEEKKVACVHIKGEHNFVSVDLASRCGEVQFNAEIEWDKIYNRNAIDLRDGTVYVRINNTRESAIVSKEEYYEIYSLLGFVLFDSFTDYIEQGEDFVLQALLNTLNGSV